MNGGVAAVLLVGQHLHGFAQWPAKVERGSKAHGSVLGVQGIAEV